MRPWCPVASASAGSSHIPRTGLTTLAVLALLWAGSPLSAQVDLEGAKTAAEILITLPDGPEPRVSVSPGSNRVVLELPRGSVFPLDFGAASGGMVRDGVVTSLDAQRVRLELELAQGLLDRVDYRPDSLTLRFTSRFDAMRPRVSGDYILGPDDKILLTVDNQPELTSHLTVTRDGTIAAPLIGDVDAAGLGPRQLALRVAELLGRNYLVDPKVEVVVEDFRSQWVMVSGEVRLPGRLALKGGTRLKEVLSEAGGLTSGAGEKITISRQVVGSEEYEILTIDRAAFERGESNPVLLGGDIIDVGEAEYCYLQGEVRSPGRISIERGMTLLRAVSLSGGVTEWADRKSVKVLYPADRQPRERVFNLRKIQNGKDEDPPLAGGEIIVVGRRYF